jgi:hypothetical protein
MREGRRGDVSQVLFEDAPCPTGMATSTNLRASSRGVPGGAACSSMGGAFGEFFCLPFSYSHPTAPPKGGARYGKPWERVGITVGTQGKTHFR